MTIIIVCIIMVIFYSLEKENKTSYKISVIAYSGPEEENPTGLAYTWV